MSCQLTLFLAFLLQRWLRWLHVLARKPRKFGAQLFKGFISSQRQRIWTMSLITGYDGILDTGIHAAALLLMGQNIATSAKQRRPPYKADLLLVVLVCQFRLKRPIWRYALVDTCGWVLSELHCHVGRGAAPAPPLQRSASKDPDIHISPNPHLASPHPTATSHFAAAVLRGWDYILWSLSLAILLLVGNCHDVTMKLWMVSFLKWYFFGKLSGNRHIRTQHWARTVVAGETDKLRAVSYPFKNMRKLTGTFLWRILPGAMFLWQQWSTKPGNFLNLHFTSNLTQIAYLTNYWRPGTKR